MTAARILTVQEPWATLIVKYGKTVENRSRNLAGDYRGPVLIHAGKRITKAGDRAWTVADEVGMNTDRYDGEEFHPGHIIGVVDLVDVHHGPEYGGGCHKLNSPLPVLPTYGLCSAWGEAEAYHLVLANPRALDEPIPYMGALGLRKTKFHVLGGVLAEAVGRCTCGAGGTWPGHEPLCGYDLVAHLEATS